MDARARSLARACLIIVSVLFAWACGQRLTRQLVTPMDIATLDAKSPFLKAHLANGGVYVLSSWSVDSATMNIQGSGSLYDRGRKEVASGIFTLPVDSIALFETNVSSGSGSKAALTVFSGITAAIAGICAASPKTCFGSCPTFYAPGPNGEMQLMAEGFSSSIAPGLEATDRDMLLDARPFGRDFTLRVTNEAFETHVIRRADVLAIPRPAGGRVYMTSEGTFHPGFDALPPERCRAAEGDCVELVSAADQMERASVADSFDLAKRETIDLEFEPTLEGDLGVVLVSRQTLMTTFLIYQALAYLGSDAGRFLASLGNEANAEARKRAGGMGRELGNIEVLVPDRNGKWIVAGSVGETGPIATDTRVVPLPIRADRNGPVRVRLRLTKGLWRLDQVALVRLGAAVTPVRVQPIAVREVGRTDSTAIRASLDPEQPLVTLPGDIYEIDYRLPEHPEDHELFLEARGYYLEWMRREWMAEESRLKAARMALSPASALRALAPAFKAQEAEIERLFWGSRYVR